MWRIYGFIVNEMYPAVYNLHLHLEDQHQVTFRSNDDLINVLNSDRSAKSMLTEFFALNRVDENARTLLYKEFPEFYVWSQQYKEWTCRKKKTVIDLRTVDGVVAPTFRDAATMHGLLQRDNSLEDCLYEASLYQMPSTEDSMFNVRRQVLRSISFTLESMGKDINSFYLLDDNICFDEDQFESREIDDELAVEIPTEDIAVSEALNSEQRYAYNSVLGKTFLYKTLLAAVRSRKLVALATASSGIVASILPGGRTAHSRFKIPLDTDEHSMCRVSKQSALAKLLRVAKLIIWDEAPMSRKQHIEALDKMLRDINDSELTFGGKVVVFCGDFRQVLPVVRKGTRQQQVDSNLVSSYLWPTLIKLHLTENMRARLDPVFSEYLLELGNGMPPITVDETIKIPDGMLVPYEDDCTSLNHLIDAVFHDIHGYSINISAMTNRAILTPKNSYVEEINALLIHRFPGELRRYYSFDEAIDASEQSVMEDFLNTLTPNGLPPHELLLKINCPIILLRNINPLEGLCNGTRLICRAFDRNVIDAEIAVGHHRGKRGNRVQATMFDKDIDSRDDTLHIFWSYYISNAYVRPLDPSLNPISLTMWGQFVQDECKKISEIIGSKPVILGTRIRVGSYNGLSLSSRLKSKFMINPALPEATSLQEWAVINDLLLERIIAKCLTYPSTSLSSVDIREIIKNCDVAEFIKSLQPMQEHLPYIENLVAEVSQKEWMIELLADPNRLNQQEHKNFNIVSIDAVQDDTK
ncbi:uncharacterized protein LOC121247218 [Juglans microcarpa x Juglans regia]|uniref:uncharacterized protein LOC121247218 n=1 Tax=Juglans microcarpa x Juglans regia TaxID=2249226 RepID=UPI001B7E4449|nr:uncharacterized protein LOC121247218 [Juglans microcarpa x Juglans regia]